MFILFLLGVIALMAWAQCEDSDFPSGRGPGSYIPPTERRR